MGIRSSKIYVAVLGLLSIVGGILSAGSIESIGRPNSIVDDPARFYLIGIFQKYFLSRFSSETPIKQGFFLFNRSPFFIVFQSFSSNFTVCVLTTESNPSKIPPCKSANAVDGRKQKGNEMKVVSLTMRRDGDSQYPWTVYQANETGVIEVAALKSEQQATFHTKRLSQKYGVCGYCEKNGVTERIV